MNELTKMTNPSTRELKKQILRGLKTKKKYIVKWSEEHSTEVEAVDTEDAWDEASCKAGNEDTCVSIDDDLIEEVK